MSLHACAVVVRGEHIEAMLAFVRDLGHRSLTTVGTVRDGLAASQWVDRRARMMVYLAEGCTWLLDGESLIAFQDDAALSRLASATGQPVLGWLCEGTSGTYALRWFAPELERDVTVSGGEVTLDEGQPLPEEAGVDWSRVWETELLQILERLGMPYDGLAGQRDYLLLDLAGGAPMPAPAARPWWKFWR